MKRIFIILFSVLLVSCSPRLIPVNNYQRDSVVVNRHITLEDSLFHIAIPKESFEIRILNPPVKDYAAIAGDSTFNHKSVIRDTVSRLATSLAESIVEIKDGKLTHILRNLDTTLDVTLKIPLETIETKKNKETEKTNIVEVEKDLNWWQKTMMIFGYIFLAEALAALIFFILRIVRGFK